MVSQSYKLNQATELLTKAHEVIRRHVDYLDEDRPLYPDNTTMQKLVKSCEILDEVEAEVGSLE